MAVRELLATGRTIDAIKLSRTVAGIGLAEAKDIVDGHLKQDWPEIADRNEKLRDHIAEIADSVVRGQSLSAGVETNDNPMNVPTDKESGY